MTEQEKQIEFLSSRLTDTMTTVKALARNYAKYISETSGKPEIEVIKEINDEMKGFLLSDILTPNP